MEEAIRLHRDAIATCDALVSDFPGQSRYRIELVRSHYSLGLALGLSGRWADAQASYRQALADAAPLGDRAGDASAASIRNDWAWMLATCPEAKVRDPQRAVELAKKAVELDPRPSYWNTLGAAQYRAGKSQEALTALEKSMELCRGGDSFDWFLVAMAHWQS